MLDANPLASFAFRPLDGEELTAVRAVARVDRGFDALVAAIVRVQFLRAAMGRALGWRGERGLALVELFLLFLLGLAPAAHDDQLRTKALLFRCGSEEDDNLGAMLCAALEADCVRLGVVAARAAHGDSPAH